MVIIDAQGTRCSETGCGKTEEAEHEYKKKEAIATPTACFMSGIVAYEPVLISTALSFLESDRHRLSAISVLQSSRPVIARPRRNAHSNREAGL